MPVTVREAVGIGSMDRGAFLLLGIALSVSTVCKIVFLLLVNTEKRSFWFVLLKQA